MKNKNSNADDKEWPSVLNKSQKQRINQIIKNNDLAKLEKLISGLEMSLWHIDGDYILRNALLHNNAGAIALCLKQTCLTNWGDGLEKAWSEASCAAIKVALSSMPDKIVFQLKILQEAGAIFKNSDLLSDIAVQPKKAETMVPVLAFCKNLDIGVVQKFTAISRALQKNNKLVMEYIISNMLGDVKDDEKILRLALSFSENPITLKCSQKNRIDWIRELTQNSGAIEHLDSVLADPNFSVGEQTRAAALKLMLKLDSEKSILMDRIEGRMDNSKITIKSKQRI